MKREFEAQVFLEVARWDQCEITLTELCDNLKRIEVKATQRNIKDI